MADKRITIKTTKEVTHKNGIPPWRAGERIITTHEELKQRGVPKGSYTVIGEVSDSNAAAPTSASKDDK